MSEKRNPHGFGPGFWWGHRRENGIWRASTSHWRLKRPGRGHDSLFIAAGRLRLRIIMRDLEASQ